MSTDIYNDICEAILDFRNTEGDDKFKSLSTDILYLAEKGVFPDISDIENVYDDPFWTQFDRILTKDDIDLCVNLLDNS